MSNKLMVEPHGKRLLTVKEISALSGLGKGKVRELIRKKILKRFLLQEKPWVVDVSEVNRVLFPPQGSGVESSLTKPRSLTIERRKKKANCDSHFIGDEKWRPS